VTFTSKITLVFYIIATTLALIMLKLGTKTGLPISYANSKISFNLNIYVLSGIVLYGLSFISYIYLISKNELGYIIPISAAFVYLIIFLASFLIFKEVFTAFKIIGIALIVIGLTFLNLKK